MNGCFHSLDAEGFQATTIYPAIVIVVSANSAAGCDPTILPVRCHKATAIKK